MKEDALDLKSEYHNTDYSDVVTRMKLGLVNLKKELNVPEGVPKPRNVRDPNSYYFAKRKWIESVRNR